MRRKLMLLAATSMLLGAFAFACDDDGDTDVTDEVQTEIGDSATSITGEVTEITDDETPSAGGAEGTTTAEADCPTPDPSGTPDPEATVPAGCPTVEADGTPTAGETP